MARQPLATVGIISLVLLLAGASEAATKRRPASATRTDVRNAISLVRQFIAVKAGDDSNKATLGTLASEEPFVLWWDDRTPLFEFVVGAGYAVVSTDTRMPPVVEYAPSGQRFSAAIQGWLADSGYLKPNSVERLYYWSGAEVVAKLRDRRTAKVILLHIPSFHITPVDPSFTISRNPALYWDAKDVQAQRTALATERPIKTLAAVLNHMKPVKYQQACASYTGLGTTEAASGNYCTPRCIAGCVPISWAMLASAWKRTPQHGSERIWAGSTCWDRDWPSDAGTRDPSRCAEVAAAIWRWHSKNDTSCEGGTSQGDIWDGHDLFEELWGLTWDWDDWDNDKDFEDQRHIIDGSEGVPAPQPYLFAASGNWSNFLQTQFGTSARPFGGGGHAVVVYGYDAGGDAKKVLISLGWGSGFADKYVDFYSFADRQLYYVEEF